MGRGSRCSVHENPRCQSATPGPAGLPAQLLSSTRSAGIAGCVRSGRAPRGEAAPLPALPLPAADAALPAALRLHPAERRVAYPPLGRAAAEAGHGHASTPPQPQPVAGGRASRQVVCVSACVPPGACPRRLRDRPAGRPCPTWSPSLETCCDPRPGVTQDGLAVRRGTGQRAAVRLPGRPAAGPAGEPAAPAPAATLALADRRQGRRHLRGLARPAEPPGPGGRVRAALQLLRRGAARHPALHAQGRLHVDAGGLRGAAVRGSGVPAGRQLPGPLPVRVLHLPEAAAAGGRRLPPARLQDQAVPRAQRGPAVLLLGPQHRAGRAPAVGAAGAVQAAVERDGGDGLRLRGPRPGASAVDATQRDGAEARPHPRGPVLHRTRADPDDTVAARHGQHLRRGAGPQPALVARGRDAGVPAHQGVAGGRRERGAAHRGAGRQRDGGAVGRRGRQPTLAVGRLAGQPARRQPPHRPAADLRAGGRGRHVRRQAHDGRPPAARRPDAHRRDRRALLTPRTGHPSVLPPAPLSAPRAIRAPGLPRHRLAGPSLPQPSRSSRLSRPSRPSRLSRHSRLSEHPE